LLESLTKSIEKGSSLFLKTIKKRFKVAERLPESIEKTHEKTPEKPYAEPLYSLEVGLRGGSFTGFRCGLTEGLEQA